MTYWLLNSVFLGVVAVVVAIAVFRRLPVRWAAVAGSMVVVLALTAVFDNVMIAAGLVGYDPARISNVFIGIAPVEDFAYAIASVLLLPALWSLLPVRSGGGRRPVHASNAKPERS